VRLRFVALLFTHRLHVLYVYTRLRLVCFARYVLFYVVIHYVNCLLLLLLIHFVVVILVVVLLLLFIIIIIIIIIINGSALALLACLPLSRVLYSIIIIIIDNVLLCIIVCIVAQCPYFHFLCSFCLSASSSHLLLSSPPLYTTTYLPSPLYHHLLGRAALVTVALKATGEQRMAAGGMRGDLRACIIRA